MEKKNPKPGSRLRPEARLDGRSRGRELPVGSYLMYSHDCVYPVTLENWRAERLLPPFGRHLLAPPLYQTLEIQCWARKTKSCPLRTCSSVGGRMAVTVTHIQLCPTPELTHCRRSAKRWVREWNDTKLPRKRKVRHFPGLLVLWVELCPPPNPYGRILMPQLHMVEF